MSERPKISVGIITYNQEKTILQTLDSILCQQGDFELEVVIGEDHSTDGTRTICEQYAENYPHVHLLPDVPNMGIMRNFARVMKACVGNYIAVCAGDDWWCDNRKLQKQLTFLETHPDYGFVTIGGYTYYVRQNKYVANLIPRIDLSSGDAKSFYFSLNYPGGVIMLPLTEMFRAELLQYIDFDEFIRREFSVEDYPMQAIFSQYTKFGHIDDCACVYRMYKESAHFVPVTNPHYLSYFRGLANIRRYLNELFPNDICFTEEWCQELEFHKEFLLYLHNLQYRKAKQLITKYEKSIANREHFIKDRKMVRSFIMFVLCSIYKEIKYTRALHRGT
ncbi:MAG: glycosyltransferase family 2 protein [Prevotellaceae bacterium]|nr:glycosyltransferase family 2 protein [Candidatus Faecinaster equi]